jgi:hypothetical protein
MPNDEDTSSIVTVRQQQSTNDDYNTLHLQPDDDQTDFITKNLNAFVKQNLAFDLATTPQPTTITNKSTPLQTIVEVINPILVGDGTVNKIAVGRSTDDETYPSFGYVNDADDDDDSDNEATLLKNAVVDTITYRRRTNDDDGGFPLSINDKMKNVLKELKQNERVRLSLSRSIDVDDVDFMGEEHEVDDDDEEEEEDEPLSGVYEERTGTNGTVFMVRERLINDFYEHEENVSNGHKTTTTVTTLLTDNFNPADFTVDVDNCQIYKNPNVDDFLYDESDKQKLREGLAFDLKNDEVLVESLGQIRKNSHFEAPEVVLTVQTTTMTETNVTEVAADEEDDEATTPTHSSNNNSNSSKKKKRKGKNKRK